MNMHAAARVTDPFGHDAGLEGIVTGVAIGALLGVGILATGGLGAISVGAALATTGAAGFAGSAIGKQMAGPETGRLATGSPDVFINSLTATMVEKATGLCRRDGPTPRQVASGSASVFINGRAAARVTDKMDCGADIRVGSENVFVGGATLSPVCTSLRNEQTKLEQFRIDAQAASAAYDPPETRTPPEGHRNATKEDLDKLRLTEEMLEHPVDENTGEATEFRAAVFINEQTGAPLVAFKGTSPLSGQDWTANVDQNRGLDTFYYTHAQEIARLAEDAPNGAGAGARLTGHSLGGGTASAGARASGLPATTFNAAGLHSNTVRQPVTAEIDAVYVRGEVLRTAQSLPGVARSAETQAWPLEPDGQPVEMGMLAAARGGPWAVGGYLAARSVVLHMMGQVDAALAKRRRAIDQALTEKGCG